MIYRQESNPSSLEPKTPIQIPTIPTLTNAKITKQPQITKTMSRMKKTSINKLTFLIPVKVKATNKKVIFYKDISSPTRVWWK